MFFLTPDPEIQAAKLVIGFTHLIGLPYNMFPFGKPFFVLTYPDKILFWYSKEAKIELPKEKITNIYLYKYSSEKTKIESSFLKATAGAALFGLAGAFIGALPESRKIKTDYTSLIIQYRNSENINSYIVLDTTKKIKSARHLINEFQQEHPEKISEPVTL